MADKSSSHVKIYDRPERKTFSPLLIGLILLVVLALGFMVYRAYFSPATDAAPTATTAPGVSAPERAPQGTNP